MVPQHMIMFNSLICHDIALDNSHGGSRLNYYTINYIKLLCLGKLRLQLFYVSNKYTATLRGVYYIVRFYVLSENWDAFTLHIFWS